MRIVRHPATADFSALGGWHSVAHNILTASVCGADPQPVTESAISSMPGKVYEERHGRERCEWQHGEGEQAAAYGSPDPQEASVTIAVEAPQRREADEQER